MGTPHDTDHIAAIRKWISVFKDGQERIAFHVGELETDLSATCETCRLWEELEDEHYGQCVKIKPVSWFNRETLADDTLAYIPADLDYSHMRTAPDFRCNLWMTIPKQEEES